MKHNRHSSVPNHEVQSAIPPRSRIHPVTHGRAPYPLFFYLALLTALLTSPAIATDSKQHGEFLGAVDTVYPDWFKTSFLELEEDVLEAKEAGKRVMLVFHQDGCPYCNAFVEQNLAQKDIEETVRKHFDAIEINMWGDREVTSIEGNQFTEKSFAEQMRVQFTPTVLFFNEVGDFVLRINGYYPPDKFRLALDYVIGKHEKDGSFNEYMAKHLKPASDAHSDTISRPYITGSANELNRLAKENKPLLLLFEQADCSNCQQLDEKVLQLEETVPYLAQYNVVRLDMWSNREIADMAGRPTTERELAKTLNVNYAPTLIFYAPDGESKREVIRSESWFKRFHTQSLMDYVASGAWENESNFQRYISARAEAIRETGVDVNIYD